MLLLYSEDLNPESLVLEWFGGTGTGSWKPLCRKWTGSWEDEATIKESEGFGKIRGEWTGIIA